MRMEWQADFEGRHPGSRRLHERATRVFADGATHEIRVQTPFPIYVERALGAHKWDVDGHRYVDYVCGHGALLLGHSHPAIVAAVAQQVARGTHFGAGHELEVRWGELVQRLVPSAERVRFLGSGTEAVLMALRVARAYTGRTNILKLAAHFHGWQDYGMAGLRAPFDQRSSPGVPAAVLDTVVVCPANDLAAVEAALRPGEVAAAIVEPTGAHFGQVPLRPDFLSDLRRLCSAHGTLLIFDEVVTGFRHSPGGVQAMAGVKPDLTTLAKILAGGLPGGAIAGRADVMAVFERHSTSNRRQRVYHPGTFNANPLSAAAGIAALEIVATGKPGAVADELAAALRRGLNEVLQARGVAGCVYGEGSIFHIHLGAGVAASPGGALHTDDPRILLGVSEEVSQALHCAMLDRGVDLMRAGGFVSAAHTRKDVELTIAAFDEALRLLDL